MTKDIFDNMIAKAKALGITKFCIRCENGNKTAYNQPDTGVIISGTDHVTIIEVSRNYYLGTGKFFNMYKLTFENIDSIEFPGITDTQAIALATSLGVYNDDVKALINDAKLQVDLKPGTAGYDAIRDNNGNTTLEPHIPGMITMGNIKD